MENLRILKEVPKYCEKTEKLGIWEVYNNTPTQGHYRFKLDNNKGDICNMFLETYITFTTEPESVPDGKYFGLQIHKRIRLRTDNTILETLTPLYMYGMVDDLVGTKAYTRIFNSVGNVVVPADLPAVVPIKIPLMFFFNRKNPLDMKGRPPMYIEIEEAGSNTSMGTNSVISNITYKLDVRYMQYESLVTSPPRELVIPNIFEEIPVIVSAESTQASMLLKCPFKVFHIYAQLRSNLQNYSLKNIKRAVISCPTSTLYDLDYEANYICGDPDDVDGYNESSTFSIKLKDRDGTDFIRFNDEMYPSYLTIYFDSSIVADFTFSVVCEYRNEINKNTILVNTGNYT